jgi:Na+-driven multidrug efflux pump
VATNNLCANAINRGNEEEGNDVLRHALIISATLGTLLFFVQYFLAEQYSNLPTLHLFNHLTHSLCARQ